MRSIPQSSAEARASPTCPIEGFERPALPEGADLGTLLVDFLYPESKNPGVWETPGFGVQDAAEFAAG